MEQAIEAAPGGGDDGGGGAQAVAFGGEVFLQVENDRGETLDDASWSGNVSDAGHMTNIARSGVGAQGAMLEHNEGVADKVCCVIVIRIG